MSNASSILSNVGSERVRRVAGLIRRQARNRFGRFLVEGPQGVREAVRHAPGAVHDVYATPEAARRHARIWQEAEAAGLYRHLVTDEVMRAMSPDAQGVLAVVAVPGDQALAPVLRGARLVVVLTAVQDPGNAGTMIRTADAVLLLRGSVEVTAPKVVRATAGSLFHLPVVTGVELEEGLTALGQAGLGLLAADARGDTDLFTADDVLTAPTAWLLGNEAHGLGPRVLQEADAVVRVPVFGHAESLNVASAAAVCLYASARAQR